MVDACSTCRPTSAMVAAIAPVATATWLAQREGVELRQSVGLPSILRRMSRMMRPSRARRNLSKTRKRFSNQRRSRLKLKDPGRQTGAEV